MSDTPEEIEKLELHSVGPVSEPTDPACAIKSPEEPEETLVGFAIRIQAEGKLPADDLAKLIAHAEEVNNYVGEVEEMVVAAEERMRGLQKEAQQLINTVALLVNRAGGEVVIRQEEFEDLGNWRVDANSQPELKRQVITTVRIDADGQRTGPKLVVAGRLPVIGQ